MRKLALSLGLAGAGLLLVVAVAAADGGPHGGFTNTSDGCAGCHRTHTAQADKLLKTNQSNLCFSCHDGTGSKLDAWDGSSLATTPKGAVNGALRGGGFVYARIDSGNAGTPGAALGNTAPGAKVTSAHVKWSDNGLTPQNVIWGSGSTGAGGAQSPALTCGDCHNPHGNGNYRILRPMPNGGTGAEVALKDETTKSYTTANYWNTYLGRTSAAFPWTSQEMSAWCSTCHTRYSTANPTDTAIFPYRHESAGTSAMTAQTDSPYSGSGYTAGCLQCHVSHGSNANMNTDANSQFSSQMPWPGGTARGNESTLLKIDNRGTCIACHGKTP